MFPVVIRIAAIRADWPRSATEDDVEAANGIRDIENTIFVTVRSEEVSAGHCYQN